MGEFRPNPKKGMPPKKQPKPLKRSPIKKKFKASGEKFVFEEVLDNLSDQEPTTCFVCGINVAIVTHCNMAHILPKGKYPKFKLNPDNIRILCYNIKGTGCHSKLDFSPKSELVGENWERLFELREQLKEEYKKL